MKTLMATDGSTEAAAALRAASRMLRHSDNDVELLCVIPEFLASKTQRGAGGRLKRIQERYQRKSELEVRSILDQAQDLLTAEGVEAKTIARMGSPADEIIKLAADYDVTVVGAGSRLNRSQFGLGPVASRVVEHASGTVLVARDLTGESNLRVLVGLDGSLASKHAIQTLMRCFEIDEAEITLMHVVETPWIQLGLDREWFDQPEDVFDQADPEIQIEKELQLEAEEVLDEAHSMLAERNYSVLTVIEEGNASTEILGEAESKDYDLIVLGAGGVADIKHDVLGSVSAKVAWGAKCSVAIVRYA